MINKPPDTLPLDIRVALRNIADEFNNAVKGSWYPAQANDVHGTHPGEMILAGGSAYIGGVLPRGTREIKEAVVRIIPTTTGTIDWTATIYHAGVGDDEALNTASSTANGLSVTDDEITEVDVTTIFAAVDANEQFGVQFTLDAVAGTANIFVLGLYLKSR